MTVFDKKIFNHFSGTSQFFFTSRAGMYNFEQAPGTNT